MDINPFLAEYPQFFLPFFRHMKPNPPAQGSSISTGNRRLVSFALISLRGIFSITGALQKQHIVGNNCPLFVQIFSTSWPATWRWIDYIHATDSSLLVSPDTPADLVLMVKTWNLRLIATALQGTQKKIHELIANTPGVLPVLVDMWIKSTNLENVDEYFLFNSLIATSAIAACIKQDANLARTFIRVLGGNLSIAATLLLKNIRRLSKIIRAQRASIGLFALVVSEIKSISDKIPGLHNTLLSQNSVTDVTRAFVRYSYFYTSNNRAVHPNIRLGCSACLGHFMDASGSGDGYTWIIQAIRARIIPAILRSATWSSPATEGELIDAIWAIQSYLVYRSVLRSVLGALNDPTIAILEVQLPRDGELWEAWVAFKRLVEIRRVDKTEFDKGGKFSQVCFSPKVGWFHPSF